jgi:hypothetical protein
VLMAVSPTLIRNADASPSVARDVSPSMPAKVRAFVRFD